ncbi:hypothetical protein Lser_V15G26384 [Lactuca serriola]
MGGNGIGNKTVPIMNLESQILSSDFKPSFTIVNMEGLLCSNLDSKLIPEHILRLSLEHDQKSVSSHLPNNSYNFYKDSNASMLAKMVDPIMNLQNRIRHLLSKWDDHLALHKIVDVIDMILSIPMNTPLAKVIEKYFGFDIVVEEAQREINVAHVEVESVENGVAIVKLMGRYSGKIHFHVCHIGKSRCESPFYLEGQGGLFEFIQQRLKENGYVVIVLAEGTGQEYVSDINDCTLGYPTYMLRAIPSNAYDNISCTLLAQSAVHGAMAGFSGFIVGSRVTEATNVVKLTDRMWARLLASTNQPTNVVKLTFPHSWS